MCEMAEDGLGLCLVNRTANQTPKKQRKMQNTAIMHESVMREYGVNGITERISLDMLSVQPVCSVRRAAT